MFRRDRPERRRCLPIEVRGGRKPERLFTQRVLDGRSWCASVFGKQANSLPQASGREIEVTGYDERLKLNDAGEDGDFHPEDGVHSAWVHLSRVGEVEIKLYVDGHDAKKSITVNVIDTTPLPLVVVTDLEALYREFRNTGMSPTVDSNKNKIPDYYDLLDRLNKYAANHGGIVVDIRQEVTLKHVLSLQLTGVPRKYQHAAIRRPHPDH